MTDSSSRKTALVVIDVQNDVMASAWAADDVVRSIGRLIARGRDAGVPVVYVQHEEDGGMEPGSEGWGIVEAIAPRDGEPVVAKRYADAFAETRLADVLQGLGARHLVMCGAMTDFCIRTSTQRALVEGYDVTLVEDCHTTEDGVFDMTDGEKVEFSAKQIVANTNRYFFGLSYPHVTATIAPAADVDFGG